MKEEVLVRYFSRYLEFFRFQQFIWRGVHGLADMQTELTEAQLRDCVDDVCEYMRQDAAHPGRAAGRGRDGASVAEGPACEETDGTNQGGHVDKGKIGWPGPGTMALLMRRSRGPT
jgi:hypothetical protein